MIRLIIDALRRVSGLHTIYDRSTCRLQAHDYPVSKGGDGLPDHFHVYRCSACGQRFTI